MLYFVLKRVRRGLSNGSALDRLSNIGLVVLGISPVFLSKYTFNMCTLKLW